MEDVLDLYQPEYNPERPVVCFDETSRHIPPWYWFRCLLQDIGCVAIPDVHPQTIAANLEVRSVPEGVTQAVVVILVPIFVKSALSGVESGPQHRQPRTNAPR